MNTRTTIGVLLLAGAVAAAGFLAYSVTHLHALHITIAHPRVLVEATALVACAVVAAALLHH